MYDSVQKKRSEGKRLCRCGLVPEGDTLAEMLDCYCRNYRPVLAEYLGIFRKLKLKEVIHYATGAVCPCCGKCHPHQRRLCRSVLDAFEAKLQASAGQIRRANDFEQLYDLICNERIKGIGPVTRYDSALRIGAYLSILPKKIVYLHGHAVIPQTPCKQQMELSHFVPLFTENGMTAFETEEFLCCFHDLLVKRKVTLVK